MDDPDSDDSVRICREEAMVTEGDCPACNEMKRRDEVGDRRRTLIYRACQAEVPKSREGRSAQHQMVDTASRCRVSTESEDVVIERMNEGGAKRAQWSRSRVFLVVKVLPGSSLDRGVSGRARRV